MVTGQTKPRTCIDTEQQKYGQIIQLYSALNFLFYLMKIPLIAQFYKNFNYFLVKQTCTARQELIQSKDINFSKRVLGSQGIKLCQGFKER